MRAEEHGGYSPYDSEIEQAKREESEGDLIADNIRVAANYSLGRASIFRSTVADNKENFKRELEEAIQYFENSKHLANFCLPFYRSFYTLTFKKENETEAQAEVQQYLSQAKRAVAGEKSKETLLEAVENLAKALWESQRLREKSLDDIMRDLDAYRRYCDRATECLSEVEEDAPGARKVVMKGLPIIDKKIKDVLKEIEEKASRLCETSRKTPLEDATRKTYDSAKGLSEVRSEIEAEIKLNSLITLLKSICRILPEDSRKVVCSQLDEMEKEDLGGKVIIIGSALTSINAKIDAVQELKEICNKLDEIKDLLTKKLDQIDYSVFKLKLSTGEVRTNLISIHQQLIKLNEIERDLGRYGLSLRNLGDSQEQALKKLDDDITRLAGELEEQIKKLPEEENIQEIREKLDHLKKPQGIEIFERFADLSSIIGLMLSSYTTYKKFF